MTKPTIISIVGPTASGKSAIAIEIAQRLDSAIICMDSATIYKHMDIGTAKPSKDEQQLVPHHLLDIIDPALSYSAAGFAQDAATIAKSLNQQGKVPVICGGTMLYYKALREGLNNLPTADPDTRAAIEQEAQEHGWPAMHAQLSTIDPETAARLAANDSQRIQRALEIWRSSGKTMSNWLAQARQPLLTNWNFITISLEPSVRQQLHQNISQRYDQMLEQGLVAEVQQLYQRPDLNSTMPSIRCVGYRQIWDYLDGKDSLELAIEKAKAATRQLAKRQITWLRAMPGRFVIDSLSSNKTTQAWDYIKSIAPGF